MSIISLSSANQVDDADFRNFFYKGIKLKPNSQVACISAVMNYSPTLVIDESNDTFNIQVGEEAFYNEGFDYKIPHGVYTAEALVSTINTNVLTTINVSYLRGSKASGGFSLNWNNGDTPPDITKGVNFSAGFTPLQTSSNPTCKALNFVGKFDGNAIVSFDSNGDGTTITKSDTHGDNTKFDGIFYTEKSLMENQHATFILRKENGDTWKDNPDVPLGIYGIFSTTDFVNNNNTKFFSDVDDGLSEENCETAIRPLFGFEVLEGQSKGKIRQIETGYDWDHESKNSSRVNYNVLEATGKAMTHGEFDLDDGENVYYIRIWLGQEEATPTFTHDNNSAFYFITTAAPNDTFVSTAATWKSWMKFGTKFYPLRVGGGILTNDSTIALEMCATDKNLSDGVLLGIAKQFSPSTWNTGGFDYTYEHNRVWGPGGTDADWEEYTDGTTTGGRPERELIFFMSKTTETLPQSYYANFGGVLSFANTMKSSTITTTGDYLYNNANFKTGEIDKPYTTAQPSLHIQLSNLPIQSYNGITSSVIRTIAVIPRQRYQGNQGNWTAGNLNWININNAEELIMSELDVRITDNSNKVIKNLKKDTEVVIMFK